MTESLVHTGSAQKDVRPRMMALIDWINGALDKPVAWPPSVLAGILHFNVVEAIRSRTVTDERRGFSRPLC